MLGSVHEIPNDDSRRAPGFHFELGPPNYVYFLAGIEMLFFFFKQRSLWKQRRGGDRGEEHVACWREDRVVETPALEMFEPHRASTASDKCLCHTGFRTLSSSGPVLDYKYFLHQSIRLGCW